MKSELLDIEAQHLANMSNEDLAKLVNELTAKAPEKADFIQNAIGNAFFESNQV